MKFILHVGPVVPASPEEHERLRPIVALFVTMFVLLYGWPHTAEAQPAMLERPIKLRVTGELLPAKDPPSEDLVTANVLVQDKPMMLRVGKVEELTSSEREQAVKWGVLFRQVRFYGPTNLLKQLEKAEGTGKALTIEGQLDTKARQFLVTAVQDTIGVTRQPAGTR